VLALQVYAAPNVVVSIPPVHSLVSAVMQGVTEPALLIPGGQSPHANSLKPSAARQLAHADLLVWISPYFELSLKKSVAQSRNMQVLTLLEQPAMQILPAREIRAWAHEHAGHDHANHAEADSETAGTVPPDMHLWLSSENALEIVRAVEAVLIEMDPKNAQNYQRNTLVIIDKIRKTKKNIQKSLLPVKAVPYLVFHDAYQYFEHEFGLSPAGAVTLSPERKPGIKSLLAIKQSISRDGVQCIFHEPQFQPRLVARIAEEAGIRTGELDPVGAALSPGPDLWFELMLSLRDNLLTCVQGS